MESNIHISAYDIAQAHAYLIKNAHELSYSMAGRLVLSSNGWLALQVPANIVKGVFDTIHEEGIELPDDYQVPVMSPDELVDNKITERGHSFNYTLGPMRSHTPNKAGISKTWYIQIYSPDLKRLRTSYGLTPLLTNTNGFQLPVAIRKTNSFKTSKSAELNKVAEHIYLREPDWDEYTLNI